MFISLGTQVRTIFSQGFKSLSPMYKLGGMLVFGRNVLPLVEKVCRSDLCTVSRCNKGISSVLLTPAIVLKLDLHLLEYVTRMFHVLNGKLVNGHRYDVIENIIYRNFFFVFQRSIFLKKSDLAL